MEFIEEFTPREKQVIECIKEGLITSEEVSERLGLVKSYVDTIFGRLYFKYRLNSIQPRAKLVWEVMNEKVHY